MTLTVDLAIGILGVIAGIGALLVTLFSMKIMKDKPEKMIILNYLGLPFSVAMILGGFALIYEDKLTLWHAGTAFTLMALYSAIMSRKLRQFNKG